VVFGDHGPYWSKEGWSKEGRRQKKRVADLRLSSKRDNPSSTGCMWTTMSPTRCHVQTSDYMIFAGTTTASSSISSPSTKGVGRDRFAAQLLRLAFAERRKNATSVTEQSEDASRAEVTDKESIKLLKGDLASCSKVL
jgi:hypothetical protein